MSDVPWICLVHRLLALFQSLSSLNGLIIISLIQGLLTLFQSIFQSGYRVPRSTRFETSAVGRRTTVEVLIGYIGVIFSRRFFHMHEVLKVQGMDEYSSPWPLSFVPPL